MAGDKLEVNADNFYETLQSNSNNGEAAAGTIFEQVIGSLAGGSGALSSTEGSSAQALTERILSNPEAVTAYEDLLEAETDSTRPKAFLNFLFFDEELNLVPEHSRLWQADGENSWSKIGSEAYAPLEVRQNGYIVAYLSNQSGQEAWFDNMTVAVTNGLLLEEQHYYAYGLPIAGLSSLAANATKSRQSYQGNEYIEERGLEWMDFHNRQYDPQLGRFLSVDPLADAGGQQVLSPYHAMGCNPVSMVDPLGLQILSPRSWGVGEPTAKDIAYMTPPTLLLDKMYGFGNDPWTLMNRGALNKYEAVMIQMAVMFENIEGRKIQAKYNREVNAEKERNRINRERITGHLAGMFKAQMKPGYQLYDGGKGNSWGVFFDGMDIGTSEHNPVLKEIAEGSGLQNYTITRSPYKIIESADNATEGAFVQIKNFKTENPEGTVILYGYSYGGVLATHLAYRLNAAGITVDYMATVDAANGPWSASVNRNITGNVLYNDNYYQTTPSIIMSRGYRNTGSNVHNYNLGWTDHHSIDEATSSYITNMMRVFLNR